MITSSRVRCLCACAFTLLVMLALAMPLSVARAEDEGAASVANAEASSENGDIESLSGPRMGSITLHIKSTGGSGYTMKGGQMSLYLVAAVSGRDTGDLAYDVANGQFPTSQAVQNIPNMTKQELDAQNANISKSLVQEIASSKVTPLETVDIKDNTAVFSSVEEGLYLLVQSKLSTGRRKVNAFLMSVPNDEGELNVEGNPKPGYAGIATDTEGWGDEEGVDMDEDDDGDDDDDGDGDSDGGSSTGSSTTYDGSSIVTSGVPQPNTGDFLVVFLPLAVVGVVLILVGSSGNKHSARKA